MSLGHELNYYTLAIRVQKGFLFYIFVIFFPILLILGKHFLITFIEYFFIVYPIPVTLYSNNDSGFIT